ncbi:MAG: MBL fold metallo-hydrolase [Candidatus Margulisiibacteriota bacterium]
MARQTSASFDRLAIKSEGYLGKMDYLKFLGTAGARFVVAKQLRASGGIWLSFDETNLLIDPGPGSLVRCIKARPKLDPTTLSGIVLSHRHLDHSADINVMMEAMTLGGREKKGIVLAPADAVSGNDPVMLRYVRSYVDKVEIIKEKGRYRIGNITIHAPLRHKHGGETYGLIFHGKTRRGKSRTIAYITDTEYFSTICNKYPADIVIVSVMTDTKKPFQHLCVDDVKEIVKKIKPRLTILTHFGMSMLKAKPWKVAEDLSLELKRKVIAAEDGMRVDL